MSGSTTSFFRGENPLRADKLNTAFSERVMRSGDTMIGMLTLARDPVAAFDAATKQYVDTRISTAIGSTGVSTFNGRTGFVQLTSADVTTALTFTPYNATNPAGYITAASIPAAPAASTTLPLVEGIGAIGATLHMHVLTMYILLVRLVVRLLVILHQLLALVHCGGTQLVGNCMFGTMMVVVSSGW